MDWKKTDPEFAERFRHFAFDEVVNEDGQQLPGETRYLAILATLIGCGGVDAYEEILPRAMENGVTPVMVKECVYQAVDYLGYGRMLPFLNATNDVFSRSGIALPLPGQATTTMENRLEKGVAAQAAIFGDRMKEAWKQSHINRWLADSCIGIYPDAMEYSLAIRIGLFLHRLCQPGEGKFVAHGQRLEQLLHHLFGNSPDVQPLDEADDLLHFLLGDVVRPQAHGEKQP